MHRNDHITATNGEHTKGDPQTNTPATVVTHDLMNAVQDEIAHVVETYLPSLDKADNFQLLKAIQKAIGSTLSNGDYVTRLDLGDAAFKDVGTGADQVAAGDHTHADLVKKADLDDAAYKGVGTGANQVAAGNHVHDDLVTAAIPIGCPIAWPTSTPPAGYLPMVGQAFSPVVYPKLAQVYPSGVLPDMRGMFTRGWSAGQGVDPGRGLLSYQSDALQNITGTYVQSGNTGVGNSATGAFSGTPGPIAYGEGGIITGYTAMTFDAARVARTSTETRPSNIAFYIICRAQ